MLANNPTDIDSGQIKNGQMFFPFPYPITTSHRPPLHVATLPTQGSRPPGSNKCPPTPSTPVTRDTDTAVIASSLPVSSRHSQ